MEKRESEQDDIRPGNAKQRQEGDDDGREDRTVRHNIDREQGEYDETSEREHRGETARVVGTARR